MHNQVNSSIRPPYKNNRYVYYFSSNKHFTWYISEKMKMEYYYESKPIYRNVND